jgi:hypothetical protein
VSALIVSLYRYIERSPFLEEPNGIIKYIYTNISFCFIEVLPGGHEHPSPALLWAIAFEGSLTRAVEKLRLSKSAMSAQIKKLEEHPLLDRHAG